MSVKTKINGEWIRHSGVNGKSAYEIACSQGFEGTIEEWLASLQGVSPTPEEVLATIPKLSGIDASLWNDGLLVEKLTDGSEISHAITFDDNGRPVQIDDVVITWPTEES